MGAIDYSKMLRELIENGGALKRQRIENVTFEESMGATPGGTTT